MILPKIQVSVSDRCQMKCVYCGREGTMESFSPKRREVSTGTLLKIIRCGIKAGLKDVHFTGGEPLLRPDLIELIEYSVELGARVEVNTNGLLLNETKVELLKEVGCSLLKISLDSVDKQKFHSITGIDNFEKVLKEIKIANQIMPVRINCVVMQSNIDIIMQMINLMNGIGILRVHFLDFTYYPLEGYKNFWQKEFVYLTREVQPSIEEKTRSKFKELSIFGCSFHVLSCVAKGTTVVLKEANPTMRSPSHCSYCQNYCHEGVFTLRLSAGGYLNICPVVNALGIDAVVALKKGRLADEYQKFLRIFDEAEQVNSFPIFLKRNKLKLRNESERK